MRRIYIPWVCGDATHGGGIRWSHVALCSLVYLAASPAAAQPVVKGVSGTVAHNQTLVISGSAFGSKPSAAPLVNTGDAIPGVPAGLIPHDDVPFVSGQVTYNNRTNLRHPFETSNVRWDFKTGRDGYTGGYFEYGQQTAAKWFVQYWVKLDSNFHLGTGSYGEPDDGVANIKIFRMFPTGSRNYSDYGYAWHGFNRGEILRFVENHEPSSRYLGTDARNWLTNGKWHLIQVQTSENSAVGVADGTIKLWIDGVLRDSASIVTNASGDGSHVLKRPYIIGFFATWGTSDQSVSNMYTYQGGVYVDNTWARVELGNAPTYDSCTLREIQAPTAWNSSSVSVRVNQGSFTAGQTAYLYVVDASGAINASGFPVTIGGSGSSTPPPPTQTSPRAPTNLRITP